MDGVLDISAPVVVDGAAVAALTMPYMNRKGARPIETTIDRLRTIAQLISSEIHGVA